MRVERFEFAVESVEAVAGGWRIEGEAGYHPRHWAQPGERFRLACNESGRKRRAVDLVVADCHLWPERRTCQVCCSRTATLTAPGSG
jgi:hypothetical protein